MIRLALVLLLLLVGCEANPAYQTEIITLEECRRRHEINSASSWGFECRHPAYPDGTFYYYRCGIGEIHAEVVDAVDLHDGEGFRPWCP